MIVFDRAQPEDLPQIVALLKDDDFGRERESADVAVYEEAFATISADPNQVLVVGRDGSEVVATLQLTFIRNLALQGKRKAQIEGVRVASRLRRRGVGTEMIRWCIDLARFEGCGVVQLTTNRGRPYSVDFYERLGFKNSHNGMKLMLDSE